MAEQQPCPILITGGGRRIGLALTHYLLLRHQPVIISYRMPYPAIGGLRDTDALYPQADFSSGDGILIFAEAVKSHTSGLRAVIHNAGDWMVEKPGVVPSIVINRIMQIHVHASYLLNHALEDLLRGHDHAAGDIIHIIDYVVERGSDKHIAYAASKAASDNMTRSFVRKLAPEVKVSAIAPSPIMFNEDDDEAYRQQALGKSLMKVAPGEKEISDSADYLFTGRYITGRSFAADGGRPLRQWRWFQPRTNSQAHSPQHPTASASANGRRMIPVKYYSDTK